MASIGRVIAEIRGTTGLPGLSASYWTLAGSAATSLEAADVVARVRAFWEAINNLLALNVTVDVVPQVDAYDVATGAVTGLTLTSSVTQVTSTGGSELPSATMMGLQLRTNTIVGRRIVKGRTFIGPLTTGTNTGAGVPDPADMTVLSDATDELATGTTAADQVVWHRPRGTVPSGGVAAPIVGYAVDSKFWYLRSRRT